MDSQLASSLQAWKTAFQQELTAQLATLGSDPDIYGFAVELPEDLANLGISSAIGRESKLVGERAGSLKWIDRRYSPVEWEFLPNAKAYAMSAQLLEEIGATYHDDFLDDDSEDTPVGSEFREALYAACLDVLSECASAGVFGSIWYKALFLSDGEHPIVRASFERLNTGRALKDAAVLYQDM